MLANKVLNDGWPLYVADMKFPFSNLDISATAWPLAVIGLAFLGGLILNLMPCVLSVLSIKLMGIVSKGGKSNREVLARDVRALSLR